MTEDTVFAMPDPRQVVLQVQLAHTRLDILLAALFPLIKAADPVTREIAARSVLSAAERVNLSLIEHPEAHELQLGQQRRLAEQLAKAIRSEE